MIPLQIYRKKNFFNGVLLLVLSQVNYYILVFSLYLQSITLGGGGKFDIW